MVGGVRRCCESALELEATLESLGSRSVRDGLVGTVTERPSPGACDEGNAGREAEARGMSSGALIRRMRLGGTGASACLIGKWSACGGVAALDGGE